MVAGVAAHEDERIGRCTRKPAHVSDGVAWAVEEVEGAVPEVVEGVEAAEHQSEVRLRDFADGAPREVGVEEGGVFVRGVAREVFLLETGADNEVGSTGEGGHVTDMVLRGVLVDVMGWGEGAVGTQWWWEKMTASMSLLDTPTAPSSRISDTFFSTFTSKRGFSPVMRAATWNTLSMYKSESEDT